MKESTFELVSFFILISVTLLGVLALIAIAALDRTPAAPALRSYQSENPQ